MSEHLIQAQDDRERLFLEQARALFRETQLVADQAPDGEVLDQAEQFVIRDGRRLLLGLLEQTCERQAQEVEKKGRRRGPARRASRRGGTKA